MGFGQTQLRHASAERLGDIDYARLMRIVRILRPRQFIRGFRKGGSILTRTGGCGLLQRGMKCSTRLRPFFLAA